MKSPFAKKREYSILAARLLITDQRMIALTYSQITINACTRHLGSNLETEIYINWQRWDHDFESIVLAKDCTK